MEDKTIMLFKHTIKHLSKEQITTYFHSELIKKIIKLRVYKYKNINKKTNRNYITNYCY